MLLFTHLAPSSERLEYSLVQYEPLNLDDTIQLLSDTHDDEPFRLLPTTESNLAFALPLLDQSSRYQVLQHIVWQQPGLDDTIAVPVRIHGGIDYSEQFPERENPPQGVSENESTAAPTAPRLLKQLDGTIKIVLRRYLHIYTDLIFRKPVTTEYEQSDGQTVQVTSLTNFRVRLHRRMRSRELHYLDHPLLGILVQITPIEKSETESVL